MCVCVCKAGLNFLFAIGLVYAGSESECVCVLSVFVFVCVCVCVCVFVHAQRLKTSANIHLYLSHIRTYYKQHDDLAVFFFPFESLGADECSSGSVGVILVLEKKRILVWQSKIPFPADE